MEQLKIYLKKRRLKKLIKYYFNNIDISAKTQTTINVQAKAFYCYFYKKIDNKIKNKDLAKKVNRNYATISKYLNNINYFKWGKYNDIFINISNKLKLK